jgi:hypothetical protein
VGISGRGWNYMKVELTGLGNLDAIELEELLGGAAVRSEDVGRPADTPQEIGTAALLFIALSPQVIAGVVAWLQKPRRRARVKVVLRTTHKDGQHEEFELEASEFAEDKLDPRVLEKLSKMTRLPTPDLKDAVAKELGKRRDG